VVQSIHLNQTLYDAYAKRTRFLGASSRHVLGRGEEVA
jgi:hypothetical protein